MDGLFFLTSIAGIAVIMWWALQNDAVPPDRPTTGLFALLPGRRVIRRRGLRAWLMPESVKAAERASDRKRPPL
jgi:hypothetical protein